MWFLVTVNATTKCIEAANPANAVFAAMRSIEYWGDGKLSEAERGYVVYSSTQKPKKMSKKEFKRIMEGHQ